MAAAGAVTLTSLAAPLISISPAGAAPAATVCTKAAYNAGDCLPYVQTTSASPLASAVRAAVLSGHGDVVDKYARKLPPTTPQSTRDEIAKARKTAPTATPNEQQRGTVQPFGGNDGTVGGMGFSWSINESYPNGTCTQNGCNQSDTLDVEFDLNILEPSVATLYGRMATRAGSTFGIKSFTCQVKHDRDFLPDPVRGSFSTCQGAPKTSTLSIPASNSSNTYTNEKQWLDIKFEFYDALSGISGGNVEYKSPNWFKDSNGRQQF